MSAANSTSRAIERSRPRDSSDLSCRGLRWVATGADGWRASSDVSRRRLGRGATGVDGSESESGHESASESDHWRSDGRNMNNAPSSTREWGGRGEEG